MSVPVSVVANMLSGCCLREIKAHLVLGKHSMMWVGFCADCRATIVEYNLTTLEEKLVGALADRETRMNKIHRAEAEFQPTNQSQRRQT